MDVAVVTGAGRGLGRAIARRLADRGLAVLATDIDAAAAARTATELGAPAWSLEHDVRDAAATRRVAEQAAGRGRLAVWVNNAGVADPGWIWDHPDEVVNRTVDVNLLGVVHGSRVAVETMRAQGVDGRILNMGSLSSIGPTPGLGVYGATKHAVLAFSLSLQGELDQNRIPIQVRTLCPDTTATDLVREVAGDDSKLLLFTGARVRDPGEVADRAVEVLYGRRLKRVVPHWRGVSARLVLFAPRPMMRALAGMARTIGRINRRRFERAA